MGQSWDPRLITAERALYLAGNIDLYLDVTEGQAHLRHMNCGQSVGLFWADGKPPMHTTTDDLLAAVLRHMVMAHDQSLSATGEKPDERDNRGSTSGRGDGGGGPETAGRRGPGDDIRRGAAGD